jgi:hypothetical protein
MYSLRHVVLLIQSGSSKVVGVVDVLTVPPLGAPSGLVLAGGATAAANVGGPLTSGVFVTAVSAMVASDEATLGSDVAVDEGAAVVADVPPVAEGNVVSDAAALGSDVVVAEGAKVDADVPPVAEGAVEIGTPTTVARVLMTWAAGFEAASEAGGTATALGTAPTNASCVVVTVTAVAP